MARYKRAYPGHLFILRSRSTQSAVLVGAGVVTAQSNYYIGRAALFGAGIVTAASIVLSPETIVATASLTGTGSLNARSSGAKLGTPQPSIPITIGKNYTSRRWIGRGIAAQFTSTTPSHSAISLQQYISPVRNVKKTRAVVGYSTVGGGISGPTPTVFSRFTTSVSRPFISRSQLPARARLGSCSTVAGGVVGTTGIAAPVFTVLGNQRSCIIHSPLPARAKVGAAGCVAGGIASQMVSAPAFTPTLTGVITTQDSSGVITTWNITGIVAS
jgi:hypothetical protein